MVDTNIGLAAALDSLTETKPKPGPRCGLGLILDQLDPASRASLETVLDKPQIGHTTIAETLQGHGFKIKATTVSRHRRAGSPNGCACPTVKATA